MSSQLDVSSDDPGLPLRHVDFSAPARPGPNTPRDRWGVLAGWRSAPAQWTLAESLAVRRLSPLGSFSEIWDSSQTLLLGLEMVGTDASADLHLGLNFENRPFY